MPQKFIQKSVRPSIRIAAALTLSLFIAVTAFPVVRKAQAAATCSSISDCTNQINNNNNTVNNLKGEATSYQDAITRLGSQIGQLRGSISANQSQQAALEQQISDAQTQIANQKVVLGEDVRTMYVDGQMSTIEALATSNNLSDYVDKEEYRTAMQSAIQDTLQKISDMEAKLTSQKQQVVNLIADQQQQASTLASSQTQQQSMLSYNQSQQADFNAQTAANQSKLAALIAAQRSANTSSKGGYYFIRFPGAIKSFNDSAYPYASRGFSMSTAPGCNDNDGPDPWGYCMRQCVSYTAWAVQATGRQAPMFWGNAKNWVGAARRAGIQVANTPQPGDVAISVTGTWGHAMYVEQVSGKMIYVAQYNQQLTGQFSHQWRQWQ